MRYQYIASTSKGQIKEGTMDAERQELVVDHLHKDGLIVIEVKPHLRAQERVIKSSILPVTHLEKVTFTKHLSIMIRAGLTVREALQILLTQTSSSRLRYILHQSVAGIDQGKKLAEVLAEHPKVFSALYTNIIRAGELSGTLAENLEGLAIQLTKDYDLRRKIRSASAYPIIVFCLAFSMGLGIAYHIFPKLTPTFADLGVPLPWPTRALMAFSDFLQNYTLFFVMGLVLAIIAIIYMLQAKWSQPLFHKLAMRLPAIRRFISNIQLARFNRVLYSLLRSGITINQALTVTAETITFLPYKWSVERAVKQVEKGESLSLTLDKERTYFPPVVTKMIDVGERTGKLEETLNYLSNFYEEEVDAAAKNFSTIIEPVLLIAVGVFVAGLALSILLPIYSLTSSILP